MPGGQVHVNTLHGSRYKSSSTGVQSRSLSLGYRAVLPTSLAARYLPTRGFLPWRPDAVISTEILSYAAASFQGVWDHANDELPRRVTSVRLHLELGSSAGASPLDWYDSPVSLVPRLETVLCVAATLKICRDFDLLPFRLLRWLSPRA